jgi:hypothetical protein
MKESERKINQYSRLLEAVNKIQLNFYQQDDFRKLLNKLFEEILILINSRFGFVAEVLRDEQETPYLNSNELLEFYLTEIPDTTIREKGLQYVLPISSQVNLISGVINDIKLFGKNAGRKIKVVPKELELVGFIEDFVRDFPNKYLLGRLVKLLFTSGKKKVKTDCRLLYTSFRIWLKMPASTLRNSNGVQRSNYTTRKIPIDFVLRIMVLAYLTKIKNSFLISFFCQRMFLSYRALVWFFFGSALLHAEYSHPAS